MDISKALVKVVVGHEISEPDLHYVMSQCAVIGVPLHKVDWNAKGSLSMALTDLDAASYTNIQLRFIQHVPCYATFHRVTNGVGDPKVFAVSAKTRVAVYCGDGEVPSASIHALGYTDEDASQEVHPSGFSAGRLAESHRRPLDVSVENGVLLLGESEDVPYYGINYIGEADPNGLGK